MTERFETDGYCTLVFSFEGPVKMNVEVYISNQFRELGRILYNLETQKLGIEIQNSATSPSLNVYHC